MQDGEDAFADPLPRLVRRGWESVASPGIREPLARLTAGLASHPGWPRWPTESDLPWLGQDPAERRTLAVAVAGHLAPGDAYSLLKLGLLSPADLGWMLRELPGLPAPGTGHHRPVRLAAGQESGDGRGQPHPGHGRRPPRVPVHRVAAGTTQHRLRAGTAFPARAARECRRGPQARSFYYARLLECLGWTRIQVIGEKSGGGADILATDPRNRDFAIQCKRYAPAKAVAIGDVRELNGALAHEHPNRLGMIVTTG